MNALIKSLQVSTVGEIDCPNPKQFNLSLTQKQFLILERILSDNWYLGATFSNGPQVSLMLKKKFWWKPKKSDSNFQSWKETPGTPREKKTSSYWKFIEVTHSRKSGRGCRSGLIIILLKLFLFKIPDLGPWRRSPPKIAARWRYRPKKNLKKPNTLKYA